MLGLKPWEFYKLSPLQLDKMVKAKQKVRTAERLEMSYFAWQVANMCRQIKDPMKFEEMAKPFLPQKTAEEIKAEREAFFEDFDRQRKEVENGNNSKSTS